MASIVRVQQPPLQIVRLVQRSEIELVVNYRSNPSNDSLFEVQSSTIDERWVFRISARDLKNGKKDIDGFRRWRAYFNKSKSRRTLHRMWATTIDRPRGTPRQDIYDGEPFIETPTHQEPYYRDFKPQVQGVRATILETAQFKSNIVKLQGLQPNTMAFYPDDFFTIYHGPNRNIPMLYQSSEQVYTDHLGRGMVEVVPALRQQVGPGQPIRPIRAEGLFQLQEAEGSENIGNIGDFYYEVSEVPEALNFTDLEI